MKFAFIATLLLPLSGLFAQLPDPVAAPEETKKTVAAPECRNLLMVKDCSGYVYSDFRNVEGRDEEIIFHSKTGKPFTGECKVCYNNGYLKMHLDYVNGHLVGLDSIFYENGVLNLITSHDELGYGKEDGKWKFYREDGSIKWEKNYEMGLAQGEHTFYYPDSTIYKVERYQNNRLHGKKQEYYRNQTPKKEIEYKNGDWDGTYITYFEDGKVGSEQQYVRGKKDGPSSYYYENGQLFYTESHSMDSREGTFRRNYATGRMWTVENYKADQRHGEFEEYYDNEKNTIKYRATYKKGQKTYNMYYDEFGGEVMSPERIEEIRKAKEAEENGTTETPKEGEEEGGKKKKKRKEK